MGDIRIRAARVEDLDDISRIKRHYILNTSITFTEHPEPLDKFVAEYEDITSHGLPYLVATEGESQQVVGYASAHNFRGSKGAYRHTVEISLFCHPDYVGRAVGRKLLTSLLEVLEHPDRNSDMLVNSRPKAPTPDIKEVLAVMAVDPDGKRGGLALKEFYERNGFEIAGHLRRVGFKFGRWIDTMYLQKSLR